MQSLCRQNQLTAVVCLVLISPMPALAAGDMHGMKMVIFEQQSDNDTVLAVKSAQGNGAGKNLKMVVFDGGVGSQMPVTPMPKEYGRNISIPADDRAPAILDAYPGKQRQEDRMQIKTYGEVGYRNDELKWNIGWPTGTPNIVSELQWYNVHSAVITGGTDITIDNWQADGKISYGQIASGKNQDSDYAGDNRQDEFSRSYSSTNDGASIDLSAGIGYHLNVGKRSSTPGLQLTPKAGYAFHTQQFNDSNGNLVISDQANARKLIPGYNSPPPGNFSGLDSTYEGTWFGPWGGLTSELIFNERFSLQASGEYHYVDYEGTANWNLRSDFQHPKSFTHKSGGEGIVVSALARYLLTPEWIIRLSVQYQDWQANDKGKGRFNFADNSVVESSFNEVEWQSYGINLGVDYVF
ncbi:MAG: hypothetical protein PSU93_13925 [Methylobacter sp.]|uniref:Protochlamydia outer membrane protein domain-containing protein n=1 Tax=Candidatus Methylobacter titanis TaxID=3053457 RepID=A0AA43TMR1_9GAMM|nr:hypothetical protein [Candidatus Methylobacter titanis]